MEHNTTFIITSDDINEIKKIVSKASISPRLLQELLTILTKNKTNTFNNLKLKLVEDASGKVYPTYVGGTKHNQ